MTIDEILFYQQFLIALAETNDYDHVVRLFNVHKVKCENKECQCHSISLNKWGRELQPEEHITQNELLETSYLDLLLLGEQTLMRSITLLYKQKAKQAQVFMLIIQHVNYISLIKKENIYGIYLSMMYLKQNKIKLAFWNKYYLFELQQVFLRKMTEFKIMNNQTQKHINEKSFPEQIKRAKSMVVINEFYSYVNMVDRLKEMVIKSVELIRKLITFRCNLSLRKTNITANSTSSCEEFILMCNELKMNNEHIVKRIKSQKKVINHYELSYIIENFYIIIQNQIPNHIKRYFPCVHSYKYFQQNDHYLNSYEEYNMSNPMILFLDHNDIFTIKYATRRHCELMHFSYSEVINQNMSIIMPSIFYEKHIFIIKQFALFSNYKFKKNTFILDKEKHLIRADVHALALPSLDLNIGVILSMRFLDRSNPTYLEYTLFLDHKYHFISSDNQFENDFFFSVEMLQALKLNYCSFLCVNEDKLNIIAQNHQEKNAEGIQTHVEDQSKINAIFHRVKLNTLLSLKKYMYKKRNHQIIFKENIPKQFLVNNIAYINRLLADNGFDIEWYTRANYLKDRLHLQGAKKAFEVKYRFSTFEQINYVIVIVKDLIINEQFNTNLTSLKNAFNNLDIVFKEKSLSPVINTKRRELSIVSISQGRRSINDYQNIISKQQRQSLDQSTSRLSKSQGLTIKELTSQSSTLGFMNKSGSFALMNNSGNNSSILQNSLTKPVLPEVQRVSITSWVFNESINIFLERSYKILLLIMILMSVFGFLFNSNNINLSKNIFYINFYSVLLKADIFYSSMGMLICCNYGSVHNELMLNDQRWRLGFRGNEMLTHFNILSSNLNLLSNQKKLVPLFSLLYTNASNYTVLQSNYEEGIKTSHLADEILYYHFFLTYLQQDSSFKQCRIQDILNSFINIKGSDTSPNFEEKIVYYIIKNSLLKVREGLEAQIIITNQILHSYHSECKNAIILFNSILYIFACIFTINCLILFFRDQKYIQLLLNIIYTKNQFDDLVEDQLATFLVALDNFNYERCNIFEIKRDTLIKIKKTNDQGLFIEMKKTYTKKTTLTMKQGFHKANNDNRYLGYTSQNNFTYVSLQHIYPELFKQKIFMIAFTFSLFITFVLLGIQLFFILNNGKRFDNLMFTNLISLNVIDRVPSLCQMIFYTKISIAANNVDLITVSPETYATNYYANYYNITIDTKSNSIFQRLGKSNYAALYYQIQEINGNLMKFASKSSNTAFLPQTFAEWNSINENNGLCMVASVGFANYYPTAGDGVVTSFQKIQSVFNKCRNYGNGITLKSFNTVIDFALEQLTQLYLEFKEGPDTPNKIHNFLTNSIFVSIDKIVGDSLKRIYNVFVVNILTDMNNLYDTANQYGLIFSMILFSICILVFFFLEFFIIKKIKRDIKILNYTKELLQNLLS